MAVASASHAALTAAACGHTAYYWRQHKMRQIASPLSHIQMITALETLQSLLENYPCSLSGSEKTYLTLLGTSLAESMENNPDAPIIISLYSGSQGAHMGRLELRRLRVVNNALCSLIPGDAAKYFSVHSNQTQRLTSLAMSQRNGQTETTQKAAIPPSQECPSDPE